MKFSHIKLIVIKRQNTHLMWNKRNGDILLRPGLNSPTSRKNSVIGDFAKLKSNILELGIVVENRLNFSFLTDRAIPKIHSIRNNSK